MTALVLLAYITGAIVCQVVAGLVFVLSRRASATPPSLSDTSAQADSEKTGWSGWRDFRVARREFEDAAQTQCSFYLEPVDGAALPPFKPGQYLTFQLKNVSSGPDRSAVRGAVVRCYSLSDKPDERTYRVTIKRVPSPSNRPDLPAGVASTHFHDRVNVGDVLSVKAPAGNFYINANVDTPAVLIAGGIGVTPMISMLRWCLAEQPGRALHLYYGVRCGADHAFKGQLALLAASNPNFRLNVVYSNPAPSDRAGADYQHTGYINIELLRRTLPHGQHEFYVCGPPAMMESLVPAIVEWGVPVSDVHFEAFGPATARLPTVAGTLIAPRPSMAVDVQFRRSGRTLVWDGTDASLLDFAERNGVAVDSGCRSGGCGSCETKVLSGEVSYTHRPDYDVAPGACLLCVGKPVAGLVLDA